MKAGLLRFLVEYDTRKDAVLPVIGGVSQPLLAAYSGTVVSEIEDQIGSGDLSMRSFLSRISVQAVREDEILPYDPDLVSFLNVNSPEDLLAAMKTLEKETSKSGNE
ncbi:MAG: hypothetical protein HYU64_17510 [Armatimonadetes bacterium]|nr:hypothetical protein [Armatimonadota bacterium]